LTSEGSKHPDYGRCFHCLDYATHLSERIGGVKGKKKWSLNLVTLKTAGFPAAYHATVRNVEETNISLVRFEVFTEVTMKNAVFWDVAPCRSCVNRRFGGTYRLHLQGRKIRDRGTSLSRCGSKGLEYCWLPIQGRRRMCGTAGPPLTQSQYNKRQILLNLW
jgi:hypothetical protein